MKQIFFALFASAAFSFTACNTTTHKAEMTDSTQVNSMMNEAMDSVNSSTNTGMDTARHMMNDMNDTMMNRNDTMKHKMK
ncbi:MAG: hypothetical protein H0W62_09940 [Chitinophagales bacterium]|nr:hypothetical protein [Chitinophagales bacterium]